MISVAGHTPSSKPPIVRVTTELLSGCFSCNGKIGFMGIGLQLVKKSSKKMLLLPFGLAGNKADVTCHGSIVL